MSPTTRSSRPQWPSCEEQINALKIPRGTALEQLVRDNQDFSTLAPSEANDTIPFPLWLRVYVRKMHPEIRFSPPKVGYPLILKEILSYMLRHPDAPQGTKARS